MRRDQKRNYVNPSRRSRLPTCMPASTQMTLAHVYTYRSAAFVKCSCTVTCSLSSRSPIETHNFLTTSVIFNGKIQHVDSPDPFHRRLLLCQYPAQEVQISIPRGAECRKDEFNHSICEFIITFTELISDVRYF